MTPLIRQATLSDRQELWDFIRSVYGDEAKYKLPDRWNWEFRDNPFLDKDNDGLPIWIAKLEGRIIGQMCAIPVKLQVGVEVLDAAWGVDLIVMPDVRGLGVGFKLNKAIAEHYGIFMALSMSRGTRRIQERLDCLTLDPVPTFARLVKLDADSLHRYVMKRRQGRPKLNRIAKILCEYLFVHRWLPPVVNSLIYVGSLRNRKAMKGAQSEIQEIDEFADDIEELWRVPNEQFDVAVSRNRLVLNWRFAGDGRLRYRKFVAHRDGKLRGYTVLRRSDPVELKVGFIVDIFSLANDEQTLQDLVVHAIRFLGREDAVIQCATTLPDCQRVLSKCGFRIVKRTEPTCFCADPKRKKHLQELNGRWFLTKADQDWDQLRPA